jgi:glycosyltransferase involved in cell wall biosynthesis
VHENVSTWFIIPVFNAEEMIGNVIRDVRQAFPNIVCVDDASSDDSASEIIKAGAQLVRHPVNLGQGASLQTGIEYARQRFGAEYFVTLDADGKHRVSDAIRMLGRVRTEPVDIILGTRHGNRRKLTWPQRIVLRTVTTLSPGCRRLVRTGAHNGLRVFNRKVADQIRITVNGAGHAMEFAAMIDRYGWRAAEEPVTILYTPHSRSTRRQLINGVNIMFDIALRTRSER